MKIVVLLSDEVDNASNVSFHLSQPKDIVACACLAAHWPFNRRLGGVNPRRELLWVGKGLLGLRSPVARGNWSGHVR